MESVSATTERKGHLEGYISQRAKARWKILQSSIRRGSALSQKELEHSIHRFAGFQLLTRRQAFLQKEYWSHTYNEIESISCTSSSISSENQSNEKLKFMLDDSDFEFIEYSTPCFKCPQQFENDSYCNPIIISRNKLPETIQFITRERRAISNRVKTNIDIHELISHAENNGVDNTGNIRVWDSSSTLAYLLLHGSCTLKYSHHLQYEFDVKWHALETSRSLPFIGLVNILSLATGDKLNTIELGGGHAALPSFLLWRIALLIPKVQINVTLTDGHKRCIVNNVMCAALSEPSVSPLVTQYIAQNDYAVPCKLPSLKIQHLVWKADVHGASICKDIIKNKTCQGFDLCLVSDCIHFVEHHASLVVTIGRLLRIDGVCILCQPARGESLHLFMSLIEALNGNNPLFDMNFHHYYDDDIYFKHMSFLKEKETHFYDPSLHYPLLLTVRKLRLFCEEADTMTACAEAERIYKTYSSNRLVNAATN